MILVPLFLAIQKLFDSSLYIVISIEIIITLFILIVPLYKKTSQNIRSFIHRLLILGICVIQIITVHFKNDTNFVSGSFVFWQPFILLSLLFLGFVNTGIYTFYKCIEFWK